MKGKWKFGRNVRVHERVGGQAATADGLPQGGSWLHPVIGDF